MWIQCLIFQIVSYSSIAKGYGDYDLTSEIFGQTQEEASGRDNQVLEDCPAHLVACARCKALNEFWVSWPTAFECFKECADTHFEIKSAAEGVHLCSLGLPPMNPSQQEVDILGWTEEEDGTVAGIVQLRQPKNEPLELEGGVWNGEYETLDTEMFPTGWGQLTYDAADHLNRLKYVGQMSSGTFDGHGTLFWKDGSRYSGDFSVNHKKGLGTLFYSNGDVFVGIWEEDKKASPGYYQYSSGGFYNGSFGTGGAREGEGVFQWAEGTKFRGQYTGGHMQQGEVTFTNGDTYKGGFNTELGNYEGEGKYVWQCGNFFEGKFEDGYPEDGILTNPHDGWSYEGEFMGGKFHGPGRFNWSSNANFFGFFLHGEMTGRGFLILENGDKFEANIPESSSEEEDEEWWLKPQTGKFTEHETGAKYFATFDGKKLRYKVPKPRSADIKGVKKGGYKK